MVTFPLPRYARVSPADRARVGRLIAKRYRKGETLRDLSTAIGRSYGWIRLVLKEQGVELRKPGSRPDTD